MLFPFLVAERAHVAPPGNSRFGSILRRIIAVSRNPADAMMH